MGVEAGGRVRFLQSYAAEAKDRLKHLQLQLSVTWLTVKRVMVSCVGGQDRKTVRESGIKDLNCARSG